MTTNPILSIDKYANFERDVVPIFANAVVHKKMDDLETYRYKAINVAESMKKLQTVGELLSVAYAGSKGFKCNAQVVRLLANYQSLGKDSQIACGEFLMASMKALQYHKMALQMVKKQNPKKAFDVLAMTSKVAAKMVTIADELVIKAQNMCDLATDALEAASTDNAIATEKRNHIKSMMTDLQAQKAKLAVETEKLQDQVVEAREGEQRAAEQADEARKEGFNIALVAAFAGPVVEFAKKYKGIVLPESDASYSDAHHAQKLKTLAKEIAEKKFELSKAQIALGPETDEEKKQKATVEIAELTTEIMILEEERSASMGLVNSLREQNNKEVDSAAEREARHHMERVRLQEREREALANLAGAVKRLKNTAVEHDTIGQALASLDLAIASLGRIMTVFLNTKAYWKAVKKHCDDLAGLGDIETVKEMEEEFIDAITESWYSWLVLGKINHTAVTTMEGVMAKVDGIMDDLPTAEEAKLRLAPMFEQIDIDMKQESEMLDAAAL